MVKIPDFLHDYSLLPENLEEAIYNSEASVYAACKADTPSCSTDSSDCSSDGAGCSRDIPCKDNVCKDTVCKYDGSCTSDHVIEPCYTDCSDTQKKYPTDYGSITVVSVTSTSVTLRLSSISNATSYVVAYRKSSTSTASMWDTTSLTVTIVGLSPNTEYVFNYYGKNSYGTGPYMPSGITATTTSRPDNWEWWSTVSKGSKIALSASEWNAFHARINEFRDYCGMSQYSFTNVSSGTTIAASIVNEAVSAISQISSSGSAPSSVSKGVTITADFFISLRNALNAIP